MNEIIDFITQIEVLGTVGVASVLSLVMFIRKQFKNGLFIKTIVGYAGAQVIKLLTSEKPEQRERANALLETVIALPTIQKLFDKLAVGADANLAMLEAELANIKVKLETGGWTEQTTQQLIKAQESIQSKLDEISS